MKTRELLTVEQRDYFYGVPEHMEGREILRYYTISDDISRLSPLGHKHINIIDWYSFILPEVVKDGQLRTLMYEENNQIKKEPDPL
ncbi:hypothetical protein [Bacillus cereus]|uniref:hypothetical protein n=1 Tax=Bacillus cereus TaxID=1396 RepID=UPI00115589FD|nr:hypothetical protein [Bacillus cereus]